MDGITPTFHTPTLLSPHLPFLQICKLPQVVNCIQIANLHKPCAHSFHNFTPSFETPAPMRFPLQQVSRVECIGAEFEDAAELTGGVVGQKENSCINVVRFEVMRDFNFASKVGNSGWLAMLWSESW